MRDCGGSINMTVYDHGLSYTRCTGEQKCPGFYYSGVGYSEDICVSRSACGRAYKGYAYAYGEERWCFKAYPAYESAFDVRDGVYSCKAGTYIHTGGNSIKCVTKKECVGYIINGAECRTSSSCRMYLHEDETGRECIDEATCVAKGLIALVRDNGTKRCVSLAQCPDADGYVFATDQGTTCVNASTCSGFGRYAYTSIHECSAQEPDPDGNFDEEQKEKHIYKCSSEHTYFDTNEEKAKCVSVAECVADDKLEYTSDDGK